MSLNTPVETLPSAPFPAQPRIGIAFLARGLHPDWEHAFQRFVNSYRTFPAGSPHRLYVIFKGYRDPCHLADGQRRFEDLPHVPIHTDDAGFDIGCYQRVAHEMREELVCFLNTKSEILCPNWLGYLAQHLDRPGVGLVGNTGSYESPNYFIPAVPKFPNPHIRTNAFLIRRELFLRIADSFEIRTKIDGAMFECGPDSLSQQVIREGMQLLVVDRHGAAHEPSSWQESGTYCTPNPAPLIGDDTYRTYLASDSAGRRDMAAIIWGPPAAEARVRASYNRPTEMNLRDKIFAVLVGKPFRLLKRVLCAVTTPNQFEALKRVYRTAVHRSHSSA